MQSGGEVEGRYVPQQLPFAGINRMEIFDNSVAVARLHFRQRIAGNNYISLIGNYAIHHDDFFHLLKGKTCGAEVSDMRITALRDR